MKGGRKVTVYFDGLCEPRNHRGGRSLRIRDICGWSESCIGEGLAAEPWSEMASNNVAEYRALIQALKWLLENGYADAEVVVRATASLQ